MDYKWGTKLLITFLWILINTKYGEMLRIFKIIVDSSVISVADIIHTQN